MNSILKNIATAALLLVASCESRKFSEARDEQAEGEVLYEFIIIKDKECVAFSLDASEDELVVRMLESIPEDMLPGHINSFGVTKDGRRYHASRQLPQTVGFISKNPGIENGAVIPANIVMWIDEDKSLLDALFNDAYSDFDKTAFKPVIRKYLGKSRVPGLTD